MTSTVFSDARARSASRCSTSSRSCCAAGWCSACWSPARATGRRCAARPGAGRHDLGMQVEVDRGTGDNRHRSEGRSHVTVLGMPLRPAAVAAIAGRIADTGANIDRIERMARYPVTAIELHVSGADPDRLRVTLAEEAAAQSVDVAVQPATLLRHGMRLVVMDVDSTLVQGEVIEMLADARRLPRARSRSVTEAGDARRARLRGVAAGAGGAAGRPRRGRPRPGVRRAGPRPGRPHAGPHAEAARLPVRDRLRRLHARSPTGSPPTSASTSPPPTSSRSSTAGSPAASSARSSTARARPTRCAASPPRPASPRAPRSRSATAPTTSTCCPPPGSASRSTPSRSCSRRRDTSVNVPYLDAIMYLLGISREEVEAADALEGLTTPAPPLALTRASGQRPT